MKKTTLTLLLVLMISATSLFAQRSNTSESHSGLNLGLGIGGYAGYYRYAGRSLPVFNINYEFNAGRNFTLAPFATFYSYRNEKEHYRESIIPVGVKGSYYLDKVLNAGSAWDFYLAGSLGFSIVRSIWDSGYTGETYYHNVSPLFLDLHVGTEYHLNNKVGIFLDLSTGVSTVGLAIH